MGSDMARLGKREREAKRSLIQANERALMAGTFERSSGDLRSSWDIDRAMSKTHTARAYVPNGEGRALPQRGGTKKRFGLS